MEECTRSSEHFIISEFGLLDNILQEGSQPPQASARQAIYVSYTSVYGKYSQAEIADGFCKPKSRGFFLQKISINLFFDQRSKILHLVIFILAIVTPQHVSHVGY